MIFVDSSALIALVKSDDVSHLRAVEWFRKNKEELFLSNLVIVETLGWLRNKLGKEVAVEMGKRLLSGEWKIVRVGASDETKAWNLFEKVEGRGISMIDCTSMVVMKRLKVKQIFTFDSDFTQVGFEVLPG